MSFMEKLKSASQHNRSLVCVGLDPDLKKLPECLKGAEHPIFEFNKAIVDATRDWVSCYKPQVPVILDVKRGDIGSTAEMYAREAFERYQADAVTVNPYMGFDTLKPFLDHADKGVIILCRTSNPNSGDLQNLMCDGRMVYEHVALLARDKWNYNNNVALVIGATYPEELKHVRGLCPEMPFLVPGVGAQGGDVEKVVRFGCDANGGGLAINSSRGIIYADRSENFGAAAGAAARQLRDLINSFR